MRRWLVPVLAALVACGGRATPEPKPEPVATASANLVPVLPPATAMVHVVAPKALVKVLDGREMDPAAGVRRRRLPAD